MVFVLFKKEFKFSFWDYEKVELYNNGFSVEGIEKLDVDLISTDVNVYYADIDEVRVVINGKEDREDKYIVSKENNMIQIKEKSYINFCFGFCFYDEEVIIFLPESFNKDIKVKETSGDVRINESFDSNMVLETVSGDVKIKNSKNVKIKTTSGDVEIGKTNDLEVHTTSGDIKVLNAKNVNIITTSGELMLEEVGNIDLVTVSGDIRIDKMEINKDSKIKTTSGDVEIRKINDVYIETNSVSGDISIAQNNRYANNKLFIKTTSGDITVS